MILTDAEDKCCGCGACVQACPAKAINMTENTYGFMYPHVDMEKCIRCDMCSKVCLYQAGIRYSSDRITFAAAATDCNLRESSSGAVFPSIAGRFIDDGGYVCGCELDEENGKLTARHIIVHDRNSMGRLRGSKYVQSDLAGVYAEIRELLNCGQKVLFSGTPCQVAGLRGFLRKDQEKLFCIDLVCHGVPSSKFFNDYIQFINQRSRIRITDFVFRDKSEGWKLHGRASYTAKDGSKRTKYFEPGESSYYQMFLNGYTYRENCYSCPYACANRPGDLTLGDFWCIELVHPEMMGSGDGVIDCNKGVSSLIINNERGAMLLRNYGAGISRRASTYEDAAKYNRQLTSPSIMSSERKIVMEMYHTEGYGPVEKWYRKRYRKVMLKRSLRSLVPKRIKKVIRKIRHR